MAPGPGCAITAASSPCPPLADAHRHAGCCGEAAPRTDGQLSVVVEDVVEDEDDDEDVDDIATPPPSSLPKLATSLSADVELQSAPVSAAPPRPDPDHADLSPASPAPPPLGSVAAAVEDAAASPPASPPAGSAPCAPAPAPTLPASPLASSQPLALDGAAGFPAPRLAVAGVAFSTPVPHAHLVNSSAPAPSPSSTLSPDAAPFKPASGGRSKLHRWADNDDDASDDERPSYLEVARRPPMCQPPAPAVDLGRGRGSRGGADADRGARPPAGPPLVTGGTCSSAVDASAAHRRHRRRGRLRRSRAELVHGLPARPVEGRIPARQRLGRRERGSARLRISGPDTDGWRQVLSLESAGGAGGVLPRPSPTTQRPRNRYPAFLQGKCFNCLSTTHRVVTCRLPPRCLRCKEFRHLARQCKLRRKVPSPPSTTAKDRASCSRASVCSDGPTGLGGVHGRAEAKAVTTASDGGRRRQRRRRHSRRLEPEVTAPPSEALPAGDTQAPSSSTVRTLVRCLPEHDPLAEAMCAGDSPPALVAFDPMLEELLAAMFVVSCPVQDTTPGFADPHPGTDDGAPRRAKPLLVYARRNRAAHGADLPRDVVEVSETDTAVALELEASSCCRGMFRKVPESLLPSPASPLVAKAPKQTRRSRRTLAPTRSSLRLAARPSPVPVAQRAQLKLRRDLDFINDKSSTADAVITEFVDTSGQDLPEAAIKAIRAATKLDNKALSQALAAIAAGSGDLEMEVS